MSLIDMSDKEKLFYYASNYTPESFRVFETKKETDSYYRICENDGIHDAAIMEFDIECYDALKEQLMRMWSDAGYENTELLATMISSIIMKNKLDEKPPGTRKCDNTAAKTVSTVNESVNDDTLSEFFYDC